MTPPSWSTSSPEGPLPPDVPPEVPPDSPPPSELPLQGTRLGASQQAPESTPPHKARYIVRPAEQFYWAVIDTSALPSTSGRRARRVRSQCRLLAEWQFPSPIESLQVALVEAAPETVVACAMDRKALTAIAGSAISLEPDRFPPEVLALLPSSGEALPRTPDMPNLLEGAFEPAAVRRERARFWTALTAAACAVPLLIALGLERRSLARRASIERINQAEAHLLNEAMEVELAAQGESGETGQPLRAQLTAEVRRLERVTVAAPASILQELDVSRPMGALLERWPVAVHATVQSLNVTALSVTVRCELPSSEAETLIEALRPWDSWRRLQPELSAREGTTTLTCRFVRSPRTAEEQGSQ